LEDKDDEIEEYRDSYVFPDNPTPDKRNEYSIENSDDFTSKIDYVYPISKDIKLESGYRGNYRRETLISRLKILTTA
jgi:hypothetical protein